MSVLTDEILQHRMDMDMTHKDLIKKLAAIKKLGVEKRIDKERILIKDGINLFLFTLYLGIKSNTRIKPQNLEELAVRGWAKNKKQYFYLIALILAKQEVQMELRLDDPETIKEMVSNKEKYQKPEVLSRKIKQLCNEYSAGGLEFLNEEYKKDPSIIDDHATVDIEKIKKILEEINKPK